MDYVALNTKVKMLFMLPNTVLKNKKEQKHILNILNYSTA